MEAPSAAEDLLKGKSSTFFFEGLLKVKRQWETFYILDDGYIEECKYARKIS